MSRDLALTKKVQAAPMSVKVWRSSCQGGYMCIRIVGWTLWHVLTLMIGGKGFDTYNSLTVATP